MTIVNIYPTKDVCIANHSIWNGYIYQAGAQDGLHIGCWDWPSTHPSPYPYRGWYAYQSRGLIEFGSLPKIPPSAIIVKAKLRMYVLSQGKSLSDFNNDFWKGSEQITLDVHRITNSWVEGIGDGQHDGYQWTGATWSHRGNGYYWGSGGGDYEATPVASLTTKYNESKFIEFDITDLYKKWCNNEVPNYGLLLKFREDQNCQGLYRIYSKQSYDSAPSVFADYVPHIVLEYNDPPDPPRGLQPAHQSTVCPHWNKLDFKWKFVDYKSKVAEYKKLDAVFLIDVSGSNLSSRSFIRQEIEKYLTKLDNEKVDYQIGFVSYSDTRIGETIDKWNFATTKDAVLKNYDNIQWKYGGDWYESGLEGIKDPYNGALTFLFRDNAEVHFFMVGDAPIHSSGDDHLSAYDLYDVGVELAFKGIRMHVINLAQYEDFFKRLIQPTGGNYYDSYLWWGDKLPIPHKYIPKEDIVTGDYQTKADVRIWKVLPGGGRMFVKKITVDGEAQSIRIDPSTIPLENNTTYEWEVTTYDSSGLTATSDRAMFVYRDDLAPYSPRKTWGPTPRYQDVVKKNIFMEIKEELLRIAPTFSDVKLWYVDELFKGEVVPSKRDFAILHNVLEKMLEGSMMKVEDYLPPDLIQGSLKLTDIQRIRHIIEHIKDQGPEPPGPMKAIITPSYLTPPETISATSEGIFSKIFTIRWGPCQKQNGGIEITTSSSPSTDVLYYRVYHNYTHSTKRVDPANPDKLLDWTENYYTDYTFTPQQFEEGSNTYVSGINERQLFLEMDGPATSHDIYVRAVDGAGRYSKETRVELRNDVTSIEWGDVKSYVVEYQVRDHTDTQPDHQGIWHLVGVFDKNIYEAKTNITAYGKVFFRVSAYTTTGRQTDYTYTTQGIDART